MMTIPVLPSSAPFSPEQRAYLNGFFAGLLGSLPEADSIAAPIQPEPESDESTLWHDPGLSFDERMELAQGKPLKLQLMAAMAQLDCGQCGYQCKTYAAAIANGEEKSLKKCAPGGKETANKLKELMATA
jgi:sulfite reductase (NADPH) flavoprotein alpha-component